MFLVPVSPARINSLSAVFTWSLSFGTVTKPHVETCRPNYSRQPENPKRALPTAPSNIRPPMIVGANAPPSRLESQMKLCAVARSRNGNHRPSARAMFGYAPASPIPKRKRIVTQRDQPLLRTCLGGKQAGKPFHASSRGSKERPTEHNAKDDGARSPSVAHPAAGNLEQDVTGNKGGEYPTHTFGRMISGHLARAALSFSSPRSWSDCSSAGVSFAKPKSRSMSPCTRMMQIRSR